MNDYDFAVKKICGNFWKNLTGSDLDAAWGIAIVYAVLNGVRPELNDLCRYLGVSRDVIGQPFKRLCLNCFEKKLDVDAHDLKNWNTLAWGYYGGYASGATGV